MSTTRRPLTGLATPLDTALELLARGFWPVAIRPKGAPIGDRAASGKEPIGPGWGLERWTDDRLRAAFRRSPDAGVGICLGPARGPEGRWLVDVEGDGPEAEASRAILFGGEVVETMGWGAARGDHQAPTADPERLLPILARLKPFESGERSQPGVYHLPNLPDLELRIGGTKPDGAVKQLQSVVPPTPGTDGRPRRWNGVEAVAEVPGAFYAALGAFADSAEDLAVAGNSARDEHRRGDAYMWSGTVVERYGAAALADECSVVAGTEEGTRNVRLNLAAFKVGRLVAAGAIDRADAERTLAEAGRRCGLGDAEVAGTIRGAIGAGMRYPRDLSHVGTGGPRRGRPSRDGRAACNGKAAGDDVGVPPRADPDAELAELPRTDLGNGERLVARFGGGVRFCHPWGKWLHYDGRRWALDQTAAIRRLAKQAVRAILAEAATIEDDGERRAHARWSRASEGRARVEAMLHFAAAEAGVPILPDEVDRDPWLFNVNNGTIDLRSGARRPHRREDLITKLCPIDYDPDATCPLWDRTLSLFFAGDAELIDYFRRICGYALAGTVRDHILPIAYGVGNNGKSTILGTLLETLGPDYAMKAPPNLLMIRRGEAHPTELADLFGKRLVCAIETEQGRHLAEALVKELTGGDKIRARRMREDFWEFAPSHTLIVGTNHKPAIRGTDHGIWRRIRLIPFTVRIDDRDADKSMPHRLLAERPGILAWCVRGCLDWQGRGLETPEAVVEATADYRREQDVLGAFLEEHTIGSESCRVKAGDLYGRYRAWAEANGEIALTQTAFGIAITERGAEKKKTNSGIWYLGLGLKQEGVSF